jgi:N-acetylmuramate 1-kinase
MGQKINVTGNWRMIDFLDIFNIVETATLIGLPDEDRDAARETLLRDAGWYTATVRPLAGDASARSYQRLAQDGETAVLMDAPPPREDVRPFVRMAQWLREQGLSAPKLIAVDDSAGFILLEDLGDDLYSSVLSAGTDEGLLYDAAVDVLADYQRATPPTGFAPYDDGFLLLEVSYFLDWYVEKHLKQTVSDGQREDFMGLWRGLLADMSPGPRVLVLRDYHADNLIWLPDRERLEKVGLLDFQGALIGSVAYDLASLARDVRRDVSDDMVERMITRYLSVTTLDGFDEESFRTAFAIAAVQRNTKIAGLFVRLAMRDGKKQYLDYLPRLIAMLQKDLAHPRLAALRSMV